MFLLKLNFNKIDNMKNRVRAVIIKNSKVLLIKRIKKESIYWVIPGGGVDKKETKKEALIRECKEELGIKIKTKGLLLKVSSRKPETEGQNEYFYLCSIVDGILGSGQGPEFQQYSSYVGKYKIEWRNIKNLGKIDLKPKEIKDLIYKRYHLSNGKNRKEHK
jgi:ADP-ribose pyrophosphatase YjhB (NUDIX family)